MTLAAGGLCCLKPGARPGGLVLCVGTKGLREGTEPR